MDNKQKTSRKGQLIRRLHTLRGAAGITVDEYQSLLDSYGVVTSTDLDERQLQGLCDFLQKRLSGGAADKDRQRKQLLAAVCRFCNDTVDSWELMTNYQRIEYAKDVACKAAQVADFNRIGTDRLRSLAYAFAKRHRDMDAVIQAVRKL